MTPTTIPSIIEKWNSDPTYVIEMLQDVQSEFHHIPKDALIEISDSLGIHPSKIHYIVTFYKFFSLEPRGKHQIQVCTGTTCHVKGAPRIMEAIERKLEIRDGETTEDLEYSIESVRCLGCCSIAPAVVINDDVIGTANSATITEIVTKESFKEVTDK